MRHIVDSDVLIDLGAQQPVVVDALNAIEPDGLGCSILSYGELFEGVVGGGGYDAALVRLNVTMELFTIIQVDLPILQRFAEIRDGLRKRGQLIGDFGIVIAATAIEHGARLVTRNRKHFERVPGLKFISPSEILSAEGGE
jgi:predicted nucleic acid-binding protein